MLAVLAVIVAMSIWLFMTRSRPAKTPSAREIGPASNAKVAVAPLAQTAWDRWSQYSGEDMSDFTNVFGQRLRPAIAKWCKVYAGRLPFQESDVTPEKFHSKVGKFLYTFMIGSTTFTVYDGPEGTRVFYMMTKEASHELNSLGNGAMQHDISMPATRQVITDLIKADSGIDYPADQISIYPTGKFSSMQGGVMVEAGGITGDNVFRAMTRTNLDFILDGNGQLVSYQH